MHVVMYLFLPTLVSCGCMSRTSQYELFAWKCKIMLDVFIGNNRKVVM
jgi:hypothetical protein